ncbi:hypothetical protein BDF14DRAFT_1751702 [Spinellus fusiger]|nr:hypothetical protein BDF14DRAFT_1751702 [Spinellus fusiger]
MSDLNWCIYCDNAIRPFSNLLYCGERCMEADSISSQPSMNYASPEFIHFSRSPLSQSGSSTTCTSLLSVPSNSPSLLTCLDLNHTSYTSSATPNFSDRSMTSTTISQDLAVIITELI